MLIAANILTQCLLSHCAFAGENNSAACSQAEERTVDSTEVYINEGFVHPLTRCFCPNVNQPC